MLAVSLDETTNFDDNQGVLRIQKDGQAFFNYAVKKPCFENKLCTCLSQVNRKIKDSFQWLIIL